MRPARRAWLLVVAAAMAMSAGVVSSRAEIGAWIAIDADSGEVLEQRDSTRQWYPASITKLMTAYIAFKAIRDGQAQFDSVVTMSKNAASEPPSKMGFKVGTQLTLDNALKMLLVKSANDIAVAVAEAIGGSEPAFIAMMNQEAQRLGMTATRFVNPHGLPDDGQLSSARDLAVLARALWREFPQYRGYFNHTAIRHGKSILKSANREYLLRVRGANGLKTGYICNSGYNVAVSATRGGRTVIAVVLGAGSGLERAAFSRQLVDRAFARRGGRSIEALRTVAGGPPPAGYCKRNKRMSAEELVAAYGTTTISKSPLLTFAGAGSNTGNRPLLPGVNISSDGDDDEEVPKTKGRKTDWGEVMDRIIGPRHSDIQAITVSTGVPGGASAPTRVAAAGPALAVAPLPGSKPLDLRPSTMMSAFESEASKKPVAVSPALFKGTLLPTTAFPLPKPVR